MDNIKISAVVISYNEEKNISSCLNSIVWSDEIILVDSYSNDNTVKIAKKFTNNIFFHKYNNSLPDQRNFAIKHARYDWIITLDGDEKLFAGAEKIIRNYLVNSKNFDGYWLPRRNYITNNFYLKYGLFYPDWQLRLLKNTDSLHYSGGPVHESLNIPLSRTKKIIQPEIYHNPSRTKYDKFSSFVRLFPYIRIEGEQFKKEKILLPVLFWRGVYAIAKEFYISFFRLSGYKDGYPGFRAALIYAVYKGSIYIYAFYRKLTK